MYLYIVILIYVLYVLKASDRNHQESNITSKTNFLSVCSENKIASTEETTPRIIITPKRHLSQIKVCIIL